MRTVDRMQETQRSNRFKEMRGTTEEMEVRDGPIVALSAIPVKMNA